MPSTRTRLAQLEARVLHLERQLYGPPTHTDANANAEFVYEIRNGVPIISSVYPYNRSLKELPQWRDDKGLLWMDLGSGTSIRTEDGKLYMTPSPPPTATAAATTVEPPEDLPSAATPRPKVDHLFSDSQTRPPKQTVFVKHSSAGRVTEPTQELPSTVTPDGWTPKTPKQPLLKGERWKWIPAHTTPGRWVITREEWEPKGNPAPINGGGVQ